MFDNFEIDVTSDKPDDLDTILQLVFRHVHKEVAKLYTVIHPKWARENESFFLADQPNEEDDALTMIFFEDSPEGDWQKVVKSMPFSINAEFASKMVRNWLKEEDVYPDEPEYNDSNTKGFRIFNETWGHVYGSRQAFIAVQPHWFMIGK